LAPQLRHETGAEAFDFARIAPRTFLANHLVRRMNPSAAALRADSLIALDV
jgi:hypothetical protein